MQVILIDDEKLAIDYLEYQLKSVSDFKIIGRYTKPFEGKQAIEQSDVDLVFLDIEIPDLNGIELANKILEKKPNLPIVFVTAYDDYAIEAFELNAIDYILKPVSTSRLSMTVNRVKQKINQMPNNHDNKMNQLQLNLFHEVELFECSDRPVSIPLKWRTTKAEQLFLYLVHYRETHVNKTFLIELLWPDLQLKNAYQQLYTTIYNIRKQLGAYSSHFSIKSIRDGYTLLLNNVVIDVEQFESFINSSLPLSADTISDYENALTISTGDFLQDYDFIWAESERQRLQLYWVNTTLKVIKWYYTHNNYERALILAMELNARYPLEEDAHFLIMKIHFATGNIIAVHRQYEELKDILLDDLQIDPRPDITKWYKKQLKNR